MQKWEEHAKMVQDGKTSAFPLLRIYRRSDFLAHERDAVQPRTMLPPLNLECAKGNPLLERLQP